MRTKTLLTGLALAFACTAFGCADEDRANVDNGEDALALEQGPGAAPRGPRDRDDDSDSDSDEAHDRTGPDGGRHHRPRRPRGPLPPGIALDGGVPHWPGLPGHGHDDDDDSDSDDDEGPRRGHRDGGRPERPERPRFPGRDGGISLPGLPGLPGRPTGPAAPTAPTGTGVVGSNRS